MQFLLSSTATNKRKGEIEKYPSCFEMREHLFVGDAT